MEPETSCKVPAEPAVLPELRELVSQAKAGNASVLPRLRHLLDAHPQIWQHTGDLEQVVVRAWTELLAGPDPLALEALRRKAEQLRADLEGDGATPLERLLVGQVVSSWLEMSHAQVQVAEPGSTTLGQASHNLRRAESAQKRYLAAIKTLTTVRALVPRGLVPVNHLRLHDPGSKVAQ
jgi:hypothetical protein